MKTIRVLALVLACGGLLALQPLPLRAQPTAPDPTSQPVIPPGKAGAAPNDRQKRGDNPPLQLSVGTITGNPAQFAGKRITLTAAVDEVFTPWSFKLDDDQLSAGGLDNDLLVVGKVPVASWGFDKSWAKQEVRVTGTVRILQADDFRREYGRGVDDKLFRQFEGKPALIADSVEKATKAR